MAEKKQRIAVFEQEGRGRMKVAGIRRFKGDLFDIHVVSLDGDYPDIIDDSTPYLKELPEADLVLNFLVHPDLAYDLSAVYQKRNVPVVATGRKIGLDNVLAPPT